MSTSVFVRACRALVRITSAWWILCLCISAIFAAVSAEQDGQKSISSSSDNEHEDVVAAEVSLLQIDGFSKFQLIGSAETGHRDIVEHHQSESNGETRCLQVWENGIQEIYKGAVIRKGVPPHPLEYAYGYDLGFVHIGKTGGGTVNNLLKSNSVPAYHYAIHACPATKQNLGNYTELLVSVRDPIDRFVSAFNWFREGLGLGQISPPYEQEQEKVRSMFDDCFPVVNSFAEQLDDSTLCGELGRSWLLGHVNHFRSHIEMGTCFHLGGVLSSLEDRPLTLIHTESLEEDFAAWMASRHYPLKTLQADSDEVQHVSTGSKFVSKLGRSMLRKYLEHEYWAQQQLEGIVRKQRVH